MPHNRYNKALIEMFNHWLWSWKLYDVVIVVWVQWSVVVVCTCVCWTVTHLFILNYRPTVCNRWPGAGMLEGLATFFATGVSVTVSFVCLHGRPNIHGGRSSVPGSSRHVIVSTVLGIRGTAGECSRDLMCGMCLGWPAGRTGEGFSSHACYRVRVVDFSRHQQYRLMCIHQ